MAKQRQTRLSKTDINKIVHIDQLVNPETPEQQAEEGLCRAYRDYLINKLGVICQQDLAMIYELKQHAKTDKEREQFDYMSRMQVNFIDG